MMLAPSETPLSSMRAFKEARRNLIAKEHPQQRWNPYSFEGGTVAAIAGDNFCVVASDARMSLLDFTVLSRNNEKIHVLNNSAALLTAGFHGDVLQLKRLLTARMHKFKFDYRTEMTVDLLSEMLGRNLYYRRFFPYFTNAILAGIDENGKGAVYRYDPIGCTERVESDTSGSAATLISPFFDAQVDWETQDKEVVPKPAMTLDRAQGLLKDAFRMATERETSTGDKLYMVTLMAGQPVKKEQFPLRED